MDVVPAEAQERIGTVLKGKWRIDQFLGAGGMAWVFAATHRNQSRVAIKMLLPEHAHDPDMCRRFLREGYVANSIAHPGVVLIYDDDREEDGTAFLVMELLEGATLHDLRAASAGWLDEWTVYRVSEQLLDVLGAAHERGVVHRDIKPSNVFLCSGGRVKVLDFGIARLGTTVHGDEPTGVGTLMGSVAYMAPEQARGLWDQVDPRTDVWAVGATLFRLLTGQYVHPAGDVMQLVEMACTRPARSLSEVAPRLPTEVTAVVDRALRFDRSERYPDAGSLRMALAGALSALDTPEPGRGDLEQIVSAHLKAHPNERELPTHVDLSPRASVTVAATPKRSLRPPALAMSRHEALDRLANFGITGADVYLIDCIPLLEMVWADGNVQREELGLLDAFMRRHVRNVNDLVGEEVLTFDQAQSFLVRFLDQRPDPSLLRLLRGLVVQIGPLSSEGVMSEQRRRNIVDFCLDIGSACVAEYPHGDHERFCREEKLLLESILNTLKA